MATITLYKFPQDVWLTMANTTSPTKNLPITDADFKVFQGAYNTIEFTVRDNVRKPVNLVGKTAEINVFSFQEETLVLVRKAEIVDARKGKIHFTFKPEDTLKLNPGYYVYSFIIRNPDETYELLYTDQDHNGASYFELIDGVAPKPLDSVRLTEDDFTPVNRQPAGAYPTIYISSAYKGGSDYLEETGLHTFSLRADNFSGKFFVQGSLVELVSTDESDWFDIWLNNDKPELEFEQFTGIEAYNFVADVLWVRFKYIPTDPPPTPPGHSGTIEKILYRN